MFLSQLRREYQMRFFDVGDACRNPCDQMMQWLQEAFSAEVLEPNAMTLSSVDASGQPDARTVLLKNMDDKGLTFFTSYTSAKGRQLAENAKVCLLFLWLDLERQVRIHGVANRISSEESDAYFEKRPLLSRMGAIVSDQSAEIPNREWLDYRMQSLLANTDSSNVKRPEQWGGYCVEPHYYEFWQGRPNRLHDRIIYRRLPDRLWSISRLAP